MRRPQTQQCGSPAVAVRLERDDDAPVQRTRRREHGRNLSWMMAVVVDNQDAVRFAAQLEPALGAAKLAQTGGDAVEWDLELQAHGHRRQRVEQVVPPLGLRIYIGHIRTGETKGGGDRSRRLIWSQSE